MTSVPSNAERRSELNGDTPSAAPDLRRVLDEAESSFARVLEKMVAGPTFAMVLAQTTENMIALSKIARDSADLAMANLRIAGRRDVVRLERQLGRTEDKLELLLQEIEGLRSELAPVNDDVT